MKENTTFNSLQGSFVITLNFISPFLKGISWNNGEIALLLNSFIKTTLASIGTQGMNAKHLLCKSYRPWASYSITKIYLTLNKPAVTWCIECTRGKIPFWRSVSVLMRNPFSITCPFSIRVTSNDRGNEKSGISNSGSRIALPWISVDPE